MTTGEQDDKKRCQEPFFHGKKVPDTFFVFAVAVVTFGAFLPMLSNDFVKWDDERTLIENRRFRGLAWENLTWMATTFHMGPYQPLSWFTYALDYKVWGLKPVGYHLTNLVLHTANAVLVYVLAVGFLRRAGRRGEIPRAAPVCAALAALAWSVHPLRVESVAWATERRDVLSGFFFLFTMIAYLGANDRAVPLASRRRRFVWAIVLYALSLASKATAMTLPVLLVILDVYPLRRLPGGPSRWLGRECRRVWLEKIPFLLLALAAATLALVGQRHAGTFMEVSLAERTAIALFAVVFYLYKTVVPLRLLPLYELPADVNPLATLVLLSGFLGLVMTAVLVALRKRVPALLAGWLCYLVVLVPVSGLAQAGRQIAADRYTYLPAVSLAIVLAAGLIRLAQPRREPVATRRPVIFAGGAIVLVLTGLTWKQTGIWHDEITLWRHTLAHDPDCEVARLNLGRELLRQGDVEGAIPELNKTLELNPNSAKAHLNLGAARLAQGDVDGAIARFRDAVRCNSRFAAAHYNLGSALLRKGDHAGAVAALQQALRLDGELIDARVNLAAAYVQAGDCDRALAEYAEALNSAPDDPDLLCNVADIHLAAGELPRAIELFQRCIRARGDFAPAHYGLGNAYARSGEADRAIAALEESIRLDPSFAKAYVNLAALRLEKKDTDAAIVLYREAIRVAPDMAMAHYNLGFTLLRAGRAKEAVPAFAQALRINPNDRDSHFHLAVAYYHSRDYAKAWDHVWRAERLGMTVNPKFIEALDQASPRPANKE